jgi:peptidoglycan/xylan/chitin deacetylase (PgdA/CDA1 family)
MNRKQACIGLLALAGAVAALLGGCAGLPSRMERSNPGVVYRVPQEKPTLYITLDDGPSESTEAILTVLKRHGAPATFFVVTDHLQPEIVRRILADGHQLGHHMKTARGANSMTDADFQKEFLEADSALLEFGGTRLFRPAGGSITESEAAFVRSRGYRVVVGTMYPMDHVIGSEDVLVTVVKWLSVNGGILILHDGPTRGRTAAAVLDRLIPDFRKKGYEFALLSQDDLPIRD